MRWQLRNQIMLPLLGVTIVSLTAVGAINGILAGRRTCANVEQQLRQVVGVLSHSSFPLTNSVLEQMRNLSSAEFVLVDPAGGIVASTLPGSAQLPPTNVTSRIQEVQLGPSASVDGRWFFHTPVKLPLGMGASRSGVLHVLFPQDEYRRAWRQAFLPSFIVGAATSLVIAAVACALANRMARAIARLREEVLRIARGDFRDVSLPKIDDEIRDLSEAVNRTAHMLTDYEQQVRRSEQMRTLTMLGASIAHQLRNAVTGCRMALDLHAADCHASENTECLDVAQRQLKLMESQLQRFLRVGRRQPISPNEPLDLGDLVEGLLPLVRPAASHARVKLDCRISSQELRVLGDGEALSQVVLNLLLNAMEAAQQQAIGQQASGRVCIEVGAANDRSAEIVISDSGAGPSAAVAESLFEPFVTDKAEGSGLGLAVAREVVAEHGGSIQWQRANGMTKFCIRLPLIVADSAHPRISTNEQNALHSLS